MRALVILVIALLTVAAIGASNHKRPLAITHASFIIPDVVSPHPPQPVVLFSPCPVGPQNFHPYTERNA